MADIQTSAGNTIAYLTNYKSYVALLSVDFGLSKRFHSGDLEIGKDYLIAFSNTTGDFTNVGADSNNVWTVFTATGTTPTSWGDATLVVDPQPTATIMNSGDSNYLGNITWKYIQQGRYEGRLPGEIIRGKTIFLYANSAYLDSTIAIGINDNFVSIQTGTGTTPDDSIIYETPVEIRVYQQ